MALKPDTTGEGSSGKPLQFWLKIKNPMRGSYLREVETRLPVGWRRCGRQFVLPITFSCMPPKTQCFWDADYQTVFISLGSFTYCRQPFVKMISWLHQYLDAFALFGFNSNI